MAGNLPEGGHTSRSLSWGGRGKQCHRGRGPHSSVRSRTGHTSLPWHAGGGGESGRLSARGTHLFARGRQRLNWDFCWLATAELSLRYWAACASWQGQVILFLSAFLSAFASLFITATERQQLTAASSIKRKVLREQKGGKNQTPLEERQGSISAWALAQWSTFRFPVNVQFCLPSLPEAPPS